MDNRLHETHSITVSACKARASLVFSFLLLFGPLDLLAVCGTLRLAALCRTAKALILR